MLQAYSRTFMRTLHIATRVLSSSADASSVARSRLDSLRGQLDEEDAQGTGEVKSRAPAADVSASEEPTRDPASFDHVAELLQQPLDEVDAEDFVSVVNEDTLEWNGPGRDRKSGKYNEPTRFGDWEQKGRCTDFS